MKQTSIALDTPFAVQQPRLIMALGSVLFAALTSAGAAVSFPLAFSPVPVSLQTFFVILSGAVLGPFWGAVSQLTYIGAGASGLPVFAGGLSGPGVLAGPTGGYLAGFVVAAWVAGYTTRPGSGWLRLISGLVVAHAVVFLFGAAHLKLFLGGSWSHGFRLGVLPFLPGLVFKVLAATGLLRKSAAPLNWFRSLG